MSLDPLALSRIQFGFTHPVWPTNVVTAKVVILGLESSSVSNDECSSVEHPMNRSPMEAGHVVSE